MGAGAAAPGFPAIRREPRLRPSDADRSDDRARSVRDFAPGTVNPCHTPRAQRKPPAPASSFAPRPTRRRTSLLPERHAPQPRPPHSRRDREAPRTPGGSASPPREAQPLLCQRACPGEITLQLGQHKGELERSRPSDGRHLPGAFEQLGQNAAELGHIPTPIPERLQSVCKPQPRLNGSG
jgi:hypothetical protein